MEKMDLSGHQCGILKLTRWAVVVPLESIFGVKVVDSQDEKQKHKQESDVELFPVFWDHRILCAYNIRKREEKSQPGLQLFKMIFLTCLKLNFESAENRETRRSVAFDQFVLLVEHVIKSQENLNRGMDIVGTHRIHYGERIHLNSGRDPVDPFLIIPCTDVR